MQRNSVPEGIAVDMVLRVNSVGPLEMSPLKSLHVSTVQSDPSGPSIWTSLKYPEGEGNKGKTRGKQVEGNPSRGR